MAAAAVEQDRKFSAGSGKKLDDYNLIHSEPQLYELRLLATGEHVWNRDVSCTCVAW